MRSHLPWRPTLGLALVAWLLIPGLARTSPGDGTRPEAWAFKLFVQDSGVYRLDFNALQGAIDEESSDDASPVLPPLPSGKLALTVGGASVPLWIDDGGDGFFGPGDHLEWIGERLHGEQTFFHEHSRHNVYRLSLTDEPRRMQGPAQATAADANDSRQQWRVLAVDDHLEEDRLMLRFAKKRKRFQRDAAAEATSEEPHRDTWHWAKMTHLDGRPFRLPLDLSTYDAKSPEPLSLQLQFAGWSQPKPKAEGMADHHIDLLLNGEPLASATWDGQETYDLVIDAIDPARIRKGRNLLEVIVPKRQRPDSEDLLIDVVLLNWLKLEYPRSHRLRAEQERFNLAEARSDRLLTLHSKPGQRYTFYGARGWRLPPEAQRITETAQQTKMSWRPPDVTDGRLSDTVYAVAEGALSAPDGIVLDRPSQLKNRQQQADYLMVVHPRLRRAIEPLAEMHRGRGLEVKVVEVDDIYDEFNHGVVDPVAIREFIGHAYHHWTAPRPQFVLLVGDASWDIKNETANDRNYADWTYRPGEKRRFSKNSSFAYANQPADPSHRNLIPAWSYASYQGHAASDNGYVTVDGDDALPDLAIGRLPVTEPTEVEAIVNKIRGYVAASPVGPWRREVLWITNEMASFQNRSNRLAGTLAEQGFDADKVYPSSDEADNQAHQAALRQSFDDGQLLVHFYGHGGRYIWRTGPPDLTKNHDLFTLDDLDLLEPTQRLPLVLSMSCYSAPFDHPTADSIGEKFLRLADRGAIAVLAASWRNSPTTRFSHRLLRELTKPQAIGEAIRVAKIESKSEAMVALYNLLGDPALPLALPQGEIPIRHHADGQLIADLSAIQLEQGRAVVTWLTRLGEWISTREVVVDGPHLELPQPDEPDGLRVQVYAWNTEEGRDGLGAYLVPEPHRAAATGDAATASPNRH